MSVDKNKLQEVIDTDIRPALQGHGGDCELVNVTDDGIVQLRLRGACNGCPSATYTVKMGIQEYLIENIPGVTSVEQVD